MSPSKSRTAPSGMKPHLLRNIDFELSVHRKMPTRIYHQVANLSRLFSASMLNRIFGTHRCFRSAPSGLYALVVTANRSFYNHDNPTPFSENCAVGLRQSWRLLAVCDDGHRLPRCFAQTLTLICETIHCCEGEKRHLSSQSSSA